MPHSTTAAPRPDSPPETAPVAHSPLFRLSAALLFVLGAGALSLSVMQIGLGLPSPMVTLAFVAFGLFTILCGFPHPYYGHVSFDRVAQYSALLIFGPVAAAAINATASLLYPWRRLGAGESPQRIATTALANAGMMALVILISGGVYLSLGGRVPLASLQQGDVVPLVAMAVTAHLLNELIIAWMVWTQGGDIKKLPSPFEYGVEIVSFAAAILLAIGYSSLDPGGFALLLILMGIAMLVLHRFALLRISLEQQVSERTRELQHKSDELDRQAKHDVLTGLYNRRFVDQRLAEQISGSRLLDQSLCLAMADLDHFKAVNDQHGHSVGDEVLRHCARIFHANLRATDIVARYGGEEFLICLPASSPEQAALICERIRAAVEQHDWQALGEGMQLSISIGVTCLQPDQTHEQLIRAADEQLYAAKAAGRNRVIGDCDMASA